MKKVLLIAAVAVLALASCKKDRTCTCTVDYGIDGVEAQTVSDTQELSKKDAEEWCDDASTSLSSLDAGSCTLD